MQVAASFRPIRLRVIVLFACITCLFGPGAIATKGFGAEELYVRSFSYKGKDFLLDGKPFVIRSGEMHYPRVPRAYWRDRFRKARAMGLNTITTYVFWNLHEPTPGKFDFSGNLDVAEFVRQAGMEGMYVIVRPGPYICSEWDFGGLPWWLLKMPDIKIRSSDKRFLKASDSYMKEVGKRLAPLEIAKGGNIIMTQIENEYGSFGSDHAYMNAIKDQIRMAGFKGLLFTSDGPGAKNLDGGSVQGVLSVVNFGAGDVPADQFKELDRRQMDAPRMVGEYWTGWFDHWGESHHLLPPWGGNEKRKPADVPSEGVEWFLNNNTSFNLYMFHGGTTFGFMAGANASRDMPIQPDTTSYDYGSPLDEAGRPTEKFFAIRDVIQRHYPDEKLPDLPATSMSMVEIPQFELKETAGIEQLLKRSVRSQVPISFETLDQAYGFVLYRTRTANGVNAELKFEEIRDYAVVSQGTRVLGRLDRRHKQNALKVNLEAGKPLDILIENMGRINFGPKMTDDRKGIVGKVLLDSTELKDWEIFSLPLTNLSGLRFGRSEVTGPAFHRGKFRVNSIGDTFLDTSRWEKGHVWVNGHHLGRFWKIGPQQTLFVPGIWLKKGVNEVIVLEVGTPNAKTLKGVTDPIFANR